MNVFIQKTPLSGVKPTLGYKLKFHGILNFPFYQCNLPANIRNIIFINMQYLPPVTQPCIVVCYESFRFYVDNFIIGLERAQDTSLIMKE